MHHRRVLAQRRHGITGWCESFPGHWWPGLILAERQAGGSLWEHLEDALSGRWVARTGIRLRQASTQGAP